MESYETPTGYQIRDHLAGTRGKVYQSKVRARNLAEKKNQAYGAHRYSANPVYASDNK